MNTKASFFIALSGLLVLSAMPARAAAGACKADIQKFCGNVKPGGGAVMHCLDGHMAELSEPCQRERGDIQILCKDDLQKFCSSVPAAHGAQASCLKAHQSELSPACQHKVSEWPANRHRQTPPTGAAKAAAPSVPVAPSGPEGGTQRQ
jgi:hypothetical protein